MFLLRNVKNSEAYLLLRVNKNTLRCHFDIFSLIKYTWLNLHRKTCNVLVQ